MGTARNVGIRHGCPVIFAVNSAAMHQGGFTFYCSDNGVWLVDEVLPQYSKLWTVLSANLAQSWNTDRPLMVNHASLPVLWATVCWGGNSPTAGGGNPPIDWQVVAQTSCPGGHCASHGSGWALVATVRQSEVLPNAQHPRVVCENAFAGVKHYNAACHVYRNRITQVDDSWMLTAAGLWNFT